LKFDQNRIIAEQFVSQVTKTVSGETTGIFLGAIPEPGLEMAISSIAIQIFF
jgi:hypothetical protein